MATPLYVLQALAEVRSSGNINMLDRRGVTLMAGDQRAVEWLDKASDRQYMDALQDMAAAESDDWMPEYSEEEDETALPDDRNFGW